jgi:hypothetical protein
MDCRAKNFQFSSEPVLRIRIRNQIHRIHMFWGLLDPDPDPLVRGMRTDPPDPRVFGPTGSGSFYH